MTSDEKVEIGCTCPECRKWVGLTEVAVERAAEVERKVPRRGGVVGRCSCAIIHDGPCPPREVVVEHVAGIPVTALVDDGFCAHGEPISAADPCDAPVFAPGRCPSCKHGQHVGSTCNADVGAGSDVRCGCPPDKAIKANTGKTKDFRLFPWEVFPELLGIWQYGISKGYLRDSWRLVPPADCEDALMRHMLALLSGETHDKESGKRHIAHVAWNAITLMALHRG